MIAVYTLFGLWLTTMFAFVLHVMYRSLKGNPVPEKFNIKEPVWWIGIANILIFVSMWIVRFNYV